MKATIGSKSIIIMVATAALAITTPPSRANSDELSATDQSFLRARNAYAIGDRQTLAALTPAFEHSVMRPYLYYWNAVLRMREDDTAVTDFLHAYPNIWLTEKLRREWAASLVDQGRQADFLAILPSIEAPGDNLLCTSWLSQPKLEESQLARLREKWFLTRPLPESCYALADPSLNLLSKLDIQRRLWSLISEGSWKEGQKLVNLVSPRLRHDFGNLDTLQKNPQKVINSLNNDESEGSRLAVALLSLARKDSIGAVEEWRKRQNLFPTIEREILWAHFAYIGARQMQPNSLSWFAEAGNTLTDEQWTTYARAALRARDWSLLTSILQRLPETLRESPRWVLWLGLAYHQQGRADLAQQQWRKIANQSNYHNLLALELLGGQAKLSTPATPRQDNELKRAASTDCVARALTLARLELQNESDGEWQWCMQGLKRQGAERTILAAADLANQAEEYHMSIYAARLTTIERDWALLYPRPSSFVDWIDAGADQVQLSHPLVYSLIRQESRFRPSARSWAGAKGLMQIMPGTGRDIARKFGERYRPNLLSDPLTNIRFGLSYLREMFDIFGDQPMAATAAYNAGPNNVRRWMPRSSALDGAIFAEIIPLAETRNYVENIFYNQVFYKLLQGAPSATLTSLLLPVHPIPFRDPPN